MNIVMVTNTYLPHVGGVARSIDAFAHAYRCRGHRVLIVAPIFPDQPEQEIDVLRVPAIQNFNGSDFSVALPVTLLLKEEMDQFQPDIVHSHHPFLMGMLALRIAHYRELPMVFTHHTLYERYTHYVPADSMLMKRFVIELATRYGNLANLVFAPSETVANKLRKRGVTTPIQVLPTGVDLAQFENRSGRPFRQRHRIPEDAFVVGHLGRLAEEKNLLFMADAIAYFMSHNGEVHFVLVGDGPMAADLQQMFRNQGLAERLHMTGTLTGEQVCDAYQAMDVFAFASKSETQGMVLTEAMACAVPVIALDASGVRELLVDGKNGRLLRQESKVAFANALQWILGLPQQKRQSMMDAARETAKKFSMENTAQQALAQYQNLLNQQIELESSAYDQWLRMGHLLQIEWEIIEGFAGATSAALSHKVSVDPI